MSFPIKDGQKDYLRYLSKMSLHPTPEEVEKLFPLLPESEMKRLVDLFECNPLPRVSRRTTLDNSNSYIHNSAEKKNSFILNSHLSLPPINRATTSQPFHKHLGRTSWDYDTRCKKALGHSSVLDPRNLHVLNKKTFDDLRRSGPNSFSLSEEDKKSKYITKNNEKENSSSYEKYKYETNSSFERYPPSKRLDRSVSMDIVPKTHEKDARRVRIDRKSDLPSNFTSENGRISSKLNTNNSINASVVIVCLGCTRTLKAPNRSCLVCCPVCRVITPAPASRQIDIAI